MRKTWIFILYEKDKMVKKVKKHEWNYFYIYTNYNF